MAKKDNRYLTAREREDIRGQGHRSTVGDVNPSSEVDQQSGSFQTDESDNLREERTRDAERSMSKWTLYRRRFMRNKAAVGGLIVFLLLVLFAIIGPYLTHWTYADVDFLALGDPPSADHWFGTDSVGGDLYAQTAHGLGRSLIIAVTVSVAVTFISALVGSFAAYLGGLAESAILAVIHFLLVVPSFLILALTVANSGGDWKVLIIALIAFGWMYFSRVIWSLAISIREREYVQAARFMGVPGYITVFRHIIPNIGSLLIINLTLGIVSTVMSETGLSFLGLGVKLPDVSLGTILSSGVNSLEASPWLFYFPAGVLTLLTVSMALVADGLRDALDPNSASGGKA